MSSPLKEAKAYHSYTVNSQESCYLLLLLPYMDILIEHCTNMLPLLAHICSQPHSCFLEHLIVASVYKYC